MKAVVGGVIIAGTLALVGAELTEDPVRAAVTKSAGSTNRPLVVLTNLPGFSSNNTFPSTGAPLAPGLYRTDPYKMLVLVPGGMDSGMVRPGNKLPRILELKPPLTFTPVHTNR